MNPIDALFFRLRMEGRKAFLPFLPAGDPDLPFTREALRAAARAGASLIEVGFPFSDPVADGSVIQSSYTRALANHLKVDDIFAMLREVSSTAGWSTPMVAMASYSLIWRRGVKEFLRDAKTAGLSGAVVPDLPVEEAGEIAQLCRDHDFKLILLVAPTTSEDRAEKIVRACGGFVYVVSVVGITGAQSTVSDRLGGLIERLRRLTDLPLCIGFGVSTPDQVRSFGKMADGVIVGSALVAKLAQASGARGREEVLHDLETTLRGLAEAAAETGHF